MMTAPWISGLTQDYYVVNGVIQWKNYLLTEAYSRIVTPYGTYMFNSTFGSYIPIWINGRNNITSNVITTEITRAVQPIIDNQKAQSINVYLQSPPTKTSIFFTLTIIDNNGESLMLDTHYISIG